MARSTLIRLGGFAVVLGLLALALHIFVDVDREDLENAIDRTGLLGPAAYAVILALGLTVPFNPSRTC